MSALSVNLLPADIILIRKQNKKISLVNQISIIGLVVLVVITIVVMILRGIQNYHLNEATRLEGLAKGKWEAVKAKEVKLFTLKQRLGLLQTLEGADIKNRNVFKMIVGLTPQETTVTELMIKKNADMTVSFASTSLPAMEQLFKDLNDKDKTKELIKKVTLESLNMGANGVYYFTLKIGVN